MSVKYIHVGTWLMAPAFDTKCVFAESFGHLRACQLRAVKGKYTKSFAN